jgi:hypothetical protein
MRNVFVSLQQDDWKAREVCEFIRGKLERIGYQLYFAKEVTSPRGTPPTEQIKSAATIIAFLREGAPEVLFELGYAYALGKRVLVVADRSLPLPLDLRNVATIDYSSSPTEVGFDILSTFESTESTGWDVAIDLPLTLGAMLRLKRERPEAFEALPEYQLLHLLQATFARQGFGVEESRGMSEYGFDLKLTTPDGRQAMIVELKKYNPNSKVSISAVQQLLGALHAYDARKAVLICTSDFTPSARAFAENYHDELVLWTTDELEKLDAGELSLEFD